MLYDTHASFFQSSFWCCNPSWDVMNYTRSFLDARAAIGISSSALCQALIHTVCRGNDQILAFLSGKAYRATQARAASSKVSPMLHPAGPGKMYPEANERLEAFLAESEAEDEQVYSAEEIPGIGAVIESPPEWGRPDEGNPNQPRRPPEYQPPQVKAIQQLWGTISVHGCMTVHCSTRQAPQPA